MGCRSFPPKSNRRRSRTRRLSSIRYQPKHGRTFREALPFAWLMDPLAVGAGGQGTSRRRALPPSALQALRRALTPDALTVGFDVWNGDAAREVVKIDRRRVPGRKHPSLAQIPALRRHKSRTPVKLPTDTSDTLSWAAQRIREIIETVA